MLHVSLCLKPTADELIDEVNSFLMWITFDLAPCATFMKIHFPGLPICSKHPSLLHLLLVARDNLIFRPPEKQAPTNARSLRSYLSRDWLRRSLGCGPSLEGPLSCRLLWRRSAERVSSTGGRYSKQASFPWVNRGLRQPVVLMLRWKAFQTQHTPHSH